MPQATGSVIYFLKPAPKKKKPEPKSTALEWIRNGYVFPGKAAPQ